MMMLCSPLWVLSVLPLLVTATHHARHLHDPRQASASSTTSATSPSSAASSGTSSGAPVTNITSPTSTPSLTFTLLSTNPTAVPLASIVANASSAPTSPLATTYAPGTQPTLIPNAPPLPNAALLSPSNYPALDKAPPTDSAEVQQWIQDVSNSGISIPDIAPTVAGGCPTNAAAAADTSRCWWTCGGCTAPTDITDCPTKLTWGLTYDDGPAYHTTQLLDYLDQQNLKSTFFVVGSRVISFPAILQAEYIGGHHIAVHTWSHPPLTTLTNDQIIAELGWSKKVIKDVLGVTPNMMRPPYGDIDNRVRAISMAMGLVPVLWTRISPTATFDTNDYNIHGGLTTVQQVLNNWENIINNATTIDNGFVVLEHDLFQETVDVATGYILPDALAHTPKFTIEPVITCLDRPLANAYIETNDNTTNPPPNPSASSGATDSAQATSTSGNSSDAMSIMFNHGFGVTVVATLVGLAAGLISIQA